MSEQKLEEMKAQVAVLASLLQQQFKQLSLEQCELANGLNKLNDMWDSIRLPPRARGRTRKNRVPFVDFNFPHSIETVGDVDRAKASLDQLKSHIVGKLYVQFEDVKGKVETRIAKKKAAADKEAEIAELKKRGNLSRVSQGASRADMELL
jgi:hypothetical protein